CAGRHLSLFNHRVPRAAPGTASHPLGGSIAALLPSTRRPRLRQRSSPRFPPVCCLHYIAQRCPHITVPSISAKLAGRSSPESIFRGWLSGGVKEGFRNV